MGVSGVGVVLFEGVRMIDAFDESTFGPWSSAELRGVLGVSESRVVVLEGVRMIGALGESTFVEVIGVRLGRSTSTCFRTAAGSFSRKVWSLRASSVMEEEDAMHGSPLWKQDMHWIELGFHALAIAGCGTKLPGAVIGTAREQAIAGEFMVSCDF